MEELGVFIFLLGTLFLIPKLVKKLDVPEQITEILLGLLLGPFFLGVITNQPIIEIMGTIGIIALFFVAGFEVDVRSIVKKKKTREERLPLLMRMTVSLRVIIKKPLISLSVFSRNTE